MKRGINAWTADPAIGFDELFASMKAAGFEGIELNIDASGAHSLTMDTSAAELAEIRALSGKHGLPVASISTSLYKGNMGSTDLMDRKAAQKLMLKQLECAQALGARGILIVPGGVTPDVSLAHAWELSMQTLKEMRPVAESYKLDVGVENVWNGFFTSPYDMVRFIDEIACTYIGAYFDAGNVAAFSWPEYWIPILGSRIKLIHIKGFARNDGRVNRGGKFCDLLTGDIRWTEVVRALREIGYQGHLTAEVSIGDAADPRADYPLYYKSVADAVGRILEVAQ